MEKKIQKIIPRKPDGKNIILTRVPLYVVDREIQAALLELLRSKKSDSIRMVAVKMLLNQNEKHREKYKKINVKKNEERQHEKEELAAAVAEARNLMAEIAAAKRDGLGEPFKMDTDGEAATDYSGG